MGRETRAVASLFHINGRRLYLREIRGTRFRPMKQETVTSSAWGGHTAPGLEAPCQAEQAHAVQRAPMRVNQRDCARLEAFACAIRTHVCAG